MIADLLPPALAVAASPFPVVPAILLLLTDRPVATAGSFLAGWWAGIAAGVTASVLLSSVVEAFDELPTWVAWVRVALGAVLVVLGVRQWRSRGDQEPPAWLASLQGSSPAGAARLGLLLSAANPKVLLLSVAAGVSIGAADASPGRTVLAVVLFAAAGSLTVALPLLAHLVLGEQARGPLGNARDRLVRHNAAVMAVVVLAIGVALLVKGAGAV